MRTITPYDLAFPHQRRWAEDRSRFKIGCMSRQVGKDWSASLDGILDICEHEIRKEPTDWLIGAPSERQSLESLDKWKRMAEAYQLVISDYREDRDGPQALMRSASITFPNGSRVIAVPGKPDTVRGFSANVLLTEFGHFEKPSDTLKAVLPSITNPLRGGKKRMSIIGTPNGQGNRFHDLWEKNHGRTGAEWSCHKVSIHDAVAGGMPIDVEELRAALDDPSGWVQEYECEFMDASGVLLTYELIGTCESDEAGQSVGSDFFDAWSDSEFYLGIDFGRSRDLTVAWLMERVGDVLFTREVLCLAGMSTPEQVEILSPRVARSKVTCVDYTGPGVGLGDYLVREHFECKPEAHKYGKVALCKATNQSNVEMFSKLRMAFEKRTLRVPAAREIREDLHSIYRVPIPSGVAYRAPHSVNGHADRCYALALATRAASLMPRATVFAELI